MSDRQPVTHELKTEPQYFEASLRGDKPYEIRRNDRGFEVGDYLRLREFDRSTEVYSGRELTVVVTHILSGAPYVPEGYVAMGVRRVDADVAELTPGWISERKAAILGVLATCEHRKAADNAEGALSDLLDEIERLRQERDTLDSGLDGLEQAIQYRDWSAVVAFLRAARKLLDATDELNAALRAPGGASDE